MEILSQLEDIRDRTLPYFDLNDADLMKSYGPGKWNVRQLLHHIVDAETVLYDRIRRGIALPNQVVWGFDQDAWALHLDYDQMPLHLNRSLYVAVRSVILHLAINFYESHGHHVVIHSNTGIRTVKDLFDKVVWHNAHHLDQIEKAIDQIN